jgi:hypothetical protein
MMDLLEYFYVARLQDRDITAHSLAVYADAV